MKASSDFAWLRQVQTDPAIISTAFELAFVILQHVNAKSGNAWPTQETLARAINASDRTVRTLLRQLADGGHLRVRHTPGRNTPNIYRIVLKKGGEMRKSASANDRNKCGSELPVKQVVNAEASFQQNGLEGGSLTSFDRKSIAVNAEASFRENSPQEPTSVIPVGDAVASNGVLESAEQPRVVVTAEADLFRRGREILGKTAGGMVKNLLKTRDGNVSLARADIEIASTKGDAREWIGAVIAGKGRDSPVLSARDRGDAW